MVATSVSAILESQWVPLISALIGSSIAYYALTSNEKKKRDFELKKEAYFNFLDVLSEGIMTSTAKHVSDSHKTAEDIGVNDIKVEKTINDPNEVWLFKLTLLSNF